ncbi:hypothetical protein COCOBI_13-1420 [Coccomyxa sp. Obi]|nr:hypothetical protein COCOBI_13-1420 [Coccomyxa sp. Obi]
MWHRTHLGIRLLQAILFHAEAQQAARGKEAASHCPVSNGDKPEDNEEEDLLPPEVLDAVIKQSREAERNEHRKATAVSKGARSNAKPGSRKGVKRPKWDPTQPRKVGPVYVQILDQLPPPSASASAKAFAQQRMFGGARKRSAEMLLPIPRQLPGRGAPSAYRGPALNPC